MAFVPLVPIGDALSRLADERTVAEQRAALATLEERLRTRRREVEAGWGPSYVERVHKKGKLTARERLARLADPGTRTFETGTFVNYGEVFPGDQRSPAAGVVTAFARVEGRWCMVIANDNTVASGSCSVGHGSRGASTTSTRSSTSISSSRTSLATKTT
jgi:acetyl-CoA carboxylase carboxyltransferase component